MLLWPLIKRYLRLRQTEFIDSISVPDELAVERSNFARALDAAEHEAVRQFANLSDELGLYCPEEPAWAGDGKSALDGASAFASAWIAYAQHHGVPTRMLDWTRKPLTAAFFASDGFRESGADRLAVWALPRHVFDSEKEKLVEFTCPRWNHTFLHAQDGVFVWQPGDMMEFIDKRSWLPLDHVVDRHLLNSRLPRVRMITLPVSRADELRRLLWRERISRAHLMPNYSTVASSLADRWRW